MSFFEVRFERRLGAADRDGGDAVFHSLDAGGEIGVIIAKFGFQIEHKACRNDQRNRKGRRLRAKRGDDRTVSTIGKFRVDHYQSRSITAWKYRRWLESEVSQRLAMMRLVRYFKRAVDLDLATLTPK